ncbi:MAG: PAS domain S-box protein [Proteobacteria bacterium]|nr:PAS domain S-box protein [Pseudomonadota bacterium]
MKKIMVVDNDVMLLEFMSDLLEKEGYHVLTAKDGLTALEKLKAYIPDIMFIDLVMPNIDGEKLCRTIRRIPELNGIYIVIVSAIAAEQEIDVTEIGANACIAKGSFDKMSQHVLYVINRLDNKVREDITGNIIGLEDVRSRDITKELLSCKRHSDTILNNVSEGILELNLNNKVIYANPFTHFLTGMREEELLGSYFTDLFDDPHKMRIKELIDLIDSGPQEIAGDLPLKLSGKMVSLNILPVYDGEHKSIIVILNDNTKRKQAEYALKKEKKFSETLVQSSPTFFVAMNSEGKVLMMNKAMLEAIDYSLDEVVGKDYLTTFIPESERDNLSKIFDNLVLNREPTINDNSILTKYGRELLVEWHGSPVFKENGEFDFFFGVGIDITKRKQADDAIRESEDKFRNFAEQSIVGINLIQDGVFKYVNPKFAEMFGYTIEECLNTMSFSKFVYPDDLPIVEEHILRRLSGEANSVRYTFRGIKKTGEIIHVEIFGSSILFNGKPASTATLLDITERRRMENEIRELSLRDHLTDLYNRRGFISLAEQQIKMAQRAEKKMQLTFIDVDGLKLINDNLGHKEGDKALIETANILRHAFRQSDIIARVGGDEFAVLAIDTMDMNSEAFSKRFQQKIDEFNAKELRKYMISMSWGTAIFDPKSFISMDELMSSADKLMYTQKRAKQKGVL